MDSSSANIFINKTGGKLLLVLAFMFVCGMLLFIVTNNIGGQLMMLAAAVVLWVGNQVRIKSGAKLAAAQELLVELRDCALVVFHQVFIRAAKKWVAALATIFVLAKKTGDYINLMARAIIKSSLRAAEVTLTPKLLPLPQPTRA